MPSITDHANAMDTGHPGKSTIQRCCTCSDDSSQLNEVNHPITVLFYGDHLPGFYSTAYFDKKNILGLHETDYFIWPNQASCSTNTKLDAVSSDYTSSNYFSVQLAEHLNAKVSPCLAFLTEMHQAMSVPDSSGSSAPTIWTRTAISSRKRISRSRPSNYSMTISSFNMT